MGANSLDHIVGCIELNSLNKLEFFASQLPASVAQWIARWTLEQEILGSSPVAALPVFFSFSWNFQNNVDVYCAFHFSFPPWNILKNRRFLPNKFTDKLKCYAKMTKLKESDGTAVDH